MPKHSLYKSPLALRLRLHGANAATSASVDGAQFDTATNVITMQLADDGTARVVDFAF